MVIIGILSLCDIEVRGDKLTAVTNLVTFSNTGMPRAVTSRSLDNQGGGLLVGEMSKVEVKIDVVERAIASLRGD